MSFIGQNPKVRTLGLTPQSADPTNPQEGMLHYSDGTARTEGVYSYRNGAWTYLGTQNFESWTPTGSWSTNTTYTGFKKRVGDMGYYAIQVALAGAPNSATLTINMPAGEVIDTSKMFVNGSSGNAIRSIIPFSNGTILDPGNNGFPLFVGYNTTTTIAPYYVITAGGILVQTSGTAVTQAAPTTFGSGDRIEIYFAVPIVAFA